MVFQSDYIKEMTVAHRFYKYVCGKYILIMLMIHQCATFLLQMNLILYISKGRFHNGSFQCRIIILKLISHLIVVPTAHLILFCAVKK